MRAFTRRVPVGIENQHRCPRRDSRILRAADQVEKRAEVGNLYINRSMIGAIVGSQPFGGEGLSGTGPKAGGPHYLYRFCAERTTSTDMTSAGGNATLLSMGDGI